MLKIINDNIDNYNYKVRELLLEIENLKLKNNGQTINNDNELLKELIVTNKLLVNKVSFLVLLIMKIIKRHRKKAQKEKCRRKPLRRHIKKTFVEEEKNDDDSLFRITLPKVIAVTTFN